VEFVFDVGVECVFDVGVEFVFDVGVECVFDVGVECVFDVGVQCVFDVGVECMVLKNSVSGSFYDDYLCTTILFRLQLAFQKHTGHCYSDNI